CTRPPQWCERHHIIEWAAGGTTDLDNLTLLCRYHHHNYAQRGWTCRLNNDRLPEWTPPRWLDPTQTPILNSRIRAHHDTPKRERPRRARGSLIQSGVT
ncbi:MAG TPA: HNH endonuclease signature motif containing protein, partial [Propionibacteriaceae bacterium]